MREGVVGGQHGQEPEGVQDVGLGKGAKLLTGSTGLTGIVLFWKPKISEAGWDCTDVKRLSEDRGGGERTKLGKGLIVISVV